MTNFAVPEVVVNKAKTLGASAWLASLPALLRELADEWGLQLGKTHDTGTEAFVIEAEVAPVDAGSDPVVAVLKLAIPREGATNFAREVAVLQAAAGEGCAELLRSDLDRNAILLERLGLPLADLGLPVGARHEILCATVSQLWRPAPELDLMTGAEKTAWLIDYAKTTWSNLDRPVSRAVVDHALRCAESRGQAHSDSTAVLVHGDVHQWNVLQAGDGYKLVDPDGLLAEAEYDLGIIMREDPVELLASNPRDRSRWLAKRCRLDEVAIWEWGVIERLTTGLMATHVGLEPVGAQLLEAATAVAAM